MKSCSLLLALSLLTLGAGCRKSEIDEKPAAAVAATSTETTASAADTAGTVASSVIKGMADDLVKDNVLIKLNLLFPPPPA